MLEEEEDDGMTLEETLRRQQAQIDGIVDALLLDPCCEDTPFQALLSELFDAENALAEGLRHKLEQMTRDGKVSGDMADAYERSIGENLSHRDGLVIVLYGFRGVRVFR